MKIEVDYRRFQKESEDFLDRVEEGETIVITQGERPIAELTPHRGEKATTHALDEVE